MIGDACSELLAFLFLEHTHFVTVIANQYDLWPIMLVLLYEYIWGLFVERFWFWFMFDVDVSKQGYLKKKKKK